MSWAWIKYTFRLIELKSNKAFTINLDLLIVWKLNIKLWYLGPLFRCRVTILQKKVLECFGQRMKIWKYLLPPLIASSWQFQNQTNQNFLLIFCSDSTNFYLEEACLWWSQLSVSCQYLNFNFQLGAEMLWVLSHSALVGYWKSTFTLSKVSDIY